MSKLSTRTRLANAPYPLMQTLWTEDDDGLGWKGIANVWTDGNSHENELHNISVRQSNPLGGIYAMVDPISHGSWASTQFEGTGITERDLQWAAAWAASEIRRKKELVKA